MSSMRDLTPPVGGENDPEVRTTELDGGIPVAYGRDAQADCRTQSEAAGQMSRELDMSGYQVDNDPESIADETRDQGWTDKTKPSGARPNRLTTSGSRGAADIGKGGL